MNIEQQLQKYEKMGFNNLQLEIIEMGLKKNIDVSIYAKLIYDESQMSTILKSLEDKLTPDQINFIANPEYTWPEMELIKTCFQNSIPEEEINNFLQLKNENKYFVIIDSLEDGLTIDQTKLLISKDYDLDQRNEIVKCFKNEFTPEQINFIANPDLEFYEMRLIRLCYERNIQQDEIDNLLNKGINGWIIMNINTDLENGLTIEQIKEYINPNLSSFERNEMRLKLNEQNKEKSLDDEIKSIESKQKETQTLNIKETQSLDELIANTPADELTGQNTDNGPSFDDK